MQCVLGSLQALSAGLGRCLPPVCAEHVAVSVDERTGEFKNSKEAKDLARRLDFHHWLVAYDVYAVLAVCFEQLTFSQAMAYKAVVVEVRGSDCLMQVVGDVYAL